MDLWDGGVAKGPDGTRGFRLERTRRLDLATCRSSSTVWCACMVLLCVHVYKVLPLRAAALHPRAGRSEPCDGV
eukprot:COSAG05_NODE_1614_length_4406_cov_2.286510_3_plen_74_part_00